MIDKINTLQITLNQATVKNKKELEAFRFQYISKKGAIGLLFDAFRQLGPTDKKIVGANLNNLKKSAQEKFTILSQQLLATTTLPSQSREDMSLPPCSAQLGALHPLTIIKNKIINIFEQIGFNISTGPEIVNDWHNFTALNFPPDHPAREMQDTFFIKKKPDIALRTHTSSVQIQVCEKYTPPIRTISVGRVFRNEAISTRSHCFFHQVEGLYINKDVSFALLKETIYYFAKQLFGAEVQLRFRASYFPFTEPSAEVDIDCFLCKRAGCNVCKYTGWVEILGAGMVDPAVLKNVQVDPTVYSGFAFGMGIERMAMLKYGIEDLRLFSENNIQFLKQFTAYG